MDESNVNASQHITQMQTYRPKTLQSPLDEAVSLLINWNLPQLCQVFQEQEVCTIAFQHLTDADIVELIPKVGPRSIFRSQLHKWREEMQNADNNTTTAHTINATLPNNVATRPTETATQTTAAIKLENMDTDTEELWLKDVDDMQLVGESEPQMESVPPSTPSTQQNETDAELEILNAQDLQADETQNAKHNDNAVSNSNQQRVSYSQNTYERVSVRDILQNSYDGRSAIDYYRQYKELDGNQRKKIVKHIITIMIEKRISMTVNCFHDLAQQLVEMFPNESFSTYYVPRMGTTCPKGALYNKYLNMCKRLRREGLLEYRVQRRVSNNTSKTRAMDISNAKGRN